MSLLQDFKKFVMRGNVLDMAVGVIIGAAFGKIVSSLVDKVMMPVIGRLTSGVDFSDMFIALDRAKYEAKGGASLHLADAVKEGIPVIAYGEFINAIINFFIVAACVFLMIKVISSLQKKEETAPAAPAAPTKDQELLTEIRDLLKSSKS
ncbi:MAG: large conductance mechanosensitive channel protein MscL [Puniceicoccales bacterium]|jgi:large conductance mechanosensitive channel|nr:large conductance mechanosensitive channel protein MscL [Puniceicoccales bacterium]